MPETVIVVTMKKRPASPTSTITDIATTSGLDRHNDTSSEEESDGEIVITNRRKSFGIRVAQTPQQAQQQVLSQIGNLAGQRQVNEVVVQATESHEKTDAEKKALEQHQKMLEAQQLAKAQQAAALQAAAARVAQAQAAAGSAQQQQAEAQAAAQQKAQAALQAAQEQAKKAQQEALARAQQAQQEALARAQQAQQEALARAQQAQIEAQARAKQAQEAQQKAQQEAIARAQDAQKRAQEEAKKKAEAAQAQAKAQADAQRKAQEEAQKKAQAAQAQAKAQADAQRKAQEVAQKKAQAAQLEAQRRAQQAAQVEAQKKQQAAQLEAQKKAAQAAQKPSTQQQQPSSQAAQAQRAQQSAAPSSQKVTTPAKPATMTGQVPQKSELTGAPHKGALAHEQPAQQEVQAATGPKWSRTPGKNTIQGPQPVEFKQVAQVAPPSGKTALRQTAQVQEQELANEKGHVVSPMVARKPQIQAAHLVERFVEKPEEQKEKMSIQKGGQLEGAKRWVADSELREAGAQQQVGMNQVERGPKAVILQDDACWQTQRRVPVEIQQPQVGKIAIPELSEKEIQRTIVAQPASYHKVQWNEFPEEQKVELAAAPKTKTQDWVPVNNEQNELQRSIYKPARMSAVWPPPQDELVKEGHSPLTVKANEDTAWIQQDQNGVLKQAVWGKTSRINRVWPPPENEAQLSDFGPQHMPVVQWPPPESEAHEREQVEVLQKHIPAKKMERQWPPPPPQYQVVESTGEIETQYNPAEMQAVNSLQMGHIQA